MSAHPIVVPTKAVVGKVTLANQVLPVVLTETLGESTHSLWKGWILEELNLQDLEEWPEAEQETGQGNCCSNGNTCVFHSDLDLGKTSLIKCQIKLMD